MFQVTKFYANFESIEKVTKIPCEKSYWQNGTEICTFSLLLMFVNFVLIITFCASFWNFFNGFEIGMKFCVFGYLLERKKIGHSNTFCKLWSQMRTKRLKISKKLCLGHSILQPSQGLSFSFRKKSKSLYPNAELWKSGIFFEGKSAQKGKGEVN